MSAKLSAKARKAILNELQAHDRYRVGYSMKAIQERHGVARQTLSRLHAERRLKGLSGKMPLEAKSPSESIVETVPPCSKSGMTDAEIQRKFEELDRRANAYERLSVEIGADTVAVLDAAARREGTTRHHIAAFAMLKWVREHYPDLSAPTASNFPRH